MNTRLIPSYCVERRLCMCFLFALFVALMLGSCTMGSDQMTVIHGSTMGTTYTIKVVDTELGEETLKVRVDDELQRLNQTFSTYIEDSELSMLNRAISGVQIELSADLMAVLTMSRDLYQQSHGAFDVTVGPLVNLWGFGPAGPGNGIPGAASIRERLAKTGADKLELGHGYVIKHAAVEVDLSAIAKGFAVDRIAEILVINGAQRYLVEIGGELKAHGFNANGRDWVVGVETPDTEQRALQLTLPVANQGMATSGDYRNFFYHGGVQYSHTLDPRTGWPVTHNMASVTVLHDSAALADGYATAFSVLGLTETMQIADAQKLKVLAILRTDKGYEEHESHAMRIYRCKESACQR